MATAVRERRDVPVADTWNLDDIFPSLEQWEEACRALERGINAFATRKGTLAQGAAALLEALQASDALGQLAYKVYYFAALHYDEDQRDNDANARRQQRAAAAGAVAAGDVVVQPRAAGDAARRRCAGGWTSCPALALYRFALEELYRQQEHVLDEKGERLLSLASQFGNAAGRHLRSAVDRRHEVPDHPAVDRRRRSRPPTRAIARSSRPTATRTDRANAFDGAPRAFRRT